MAAGRRINKGNYDMKRFVMLIRLEIKKYRKGFPGLLLSAAILCLIVFGMALMGQQLISGVGSITQENGQCKYDTGYRLCQCKGGKTPSGGK